MALKAISIVRGLVRVLVARSVEKVASEHCTIVDDGTIPNRRGSLAVDDEGIAGTVHTVLIEDGILKRLHAG